MKAANVVTIFRSIADSDPIVVSLWLQTEAGKVALADNATVDLRLLIGQAVLAVAGTGKGAGSGIWAFDATGLPQTVGKVRFSIEVTVDGYSYTHGRGWINLADRV